MQAHRVLARKWRPNSFADVVGQPHVLQALRHALSSGRLHHAYLFTGTRGVGKTTLARVLARSLNCETGVTPDPCGVCAACRGIEEGRFVDLIELDAASNTQVDRMRELLENATYAPTAGRFKVYVIDEVHQLSGSAFNAMLKTLEEPPDHVKFVLATTDPQKIPVTVLSRCMQFGLKPIAAAVIAARMTHILAEEGVEAEPAALDLLARAAQGSLRDALSLLDQAIAFGGGRVLAAPVAEMLGVADLDALLAILQAVSQGDAEAALAAADALAGRGVALDGALQELARLIRQAALCKALPAAVPDTPDGVAALAARLSATDLQVLYQIAVHARSELDWAPDAESGFVMAVLRMIALLGPGAEPAVLAPAEGGVAAAPVSRPDTLAAPAAAPAQPLPALALAVSEAKPTAAETRAADAAPFDGDWPALVQRMGLGGKTRMLADRCVLAAHDATTLRLELGDAFRRMLDLAVRDKLAEAVVAALGRSVRVDIVVVEQAAASGMETPIARRESARAAQQAQAVESIRSDPFVRGLIDEMGGVLLDSSIRPLHNQITNPGEVSP
ncbi:MAG: DNA polymerase III subunit gamma/tau [Burkholderiales bacterium]|nr:DNA polymerase III subunit gamma/tau [Burkholderiales bacterium]